METVTKPNVKVVGDDGNVFAMLGKCTKALKAIGRKEDADALTKEVFGADSYDAAIQFMMKYCNLR